MTYRERLEEWAEENGTYGRCPRCHRRIWIESACLPECSCGWEEERDRCPDCESMLTDGECRVCAETTEVLEEQS